MSYLDTARRVLAEFRAQNRPVSTEGYERTKETKEGPLSIFRPDPFESDPGDLAGELSGWTPVAWESADCPSFAFDPELSIRTADVRSVLGWDRESRAAEGR